MRQVSPEAPPRSRSAAAAAPQEEGFSISLDDIYHTVFRHKLKIILCALVGLTAAGTWYSVQKPTYISEARLYVRFVAMEGVPTRSSPDDPVIKTPDMRGETIMNSEQEIASSFDLIKQVAQVIGPEKILAPFGGGSDLNSAAIILRKGLLVQTSSSIMGISFQHPDHELIQPVLREVIQQYFKKHMEIHHSSSMSGDILTQETDTLKSKLSMTEDELRKAKNKAGVVSVEDAKKVNSQQVATIRTEIFAAEAELAERTAALQENAKLVKKENAEAAAPKAAPSETAPAATETTAAEAAVSPELFEEYRSAAIRAETLRQQEVELLRVYTPESTRAKTLHAQVLEAQAKKQEIETANPRLMAALSRTAPATAGQPGPPTPGTRSAYDPAAEIVHINSLKAKIKVLNSQIDTLRAESAALSQLEGNIQDLMRKRDLEETNYRRYAASQEAARINDALGSGKVSNISIIQTPSTPAVADKNRLKIPGGLAGGGLALGLVWAFLFELFLDPTVRRPVDVEKKLRMPLFLSIPDLALPRPGRISRWRNRKQLAAPAAKPPSDSTVVAIEKTDVPDSKTSPAVSEESLQPFHETLRDRLISYCESQNLTRKPKLIAVTGLGRKSGVTTTAAGLARTLSETGEGNVLLVDLTSSQGSAMQFLKGAPTRGLDELLDSKDNVQVQQNLYVVTDSNNSEQLSRNLPRRFTKLIPKIKASDFDYVVFDMPPVSQLSITPRLAGFMDIVLFVVESEKTNLDMVKRATALLGSSKAHVGAILNKTHNYVPQRLHQDNLSHF